MHVLPPLNGKEPALHLYRYLGHTELVTAVVPVRNPKGYASCSWDKSVSLWNGYELDPITARHHSKLLQCPQDFFNELHGSTKTMSEFEKKNPKFIPASLNVRTKSSTACCPITPMLSVCQNLSFAMYGLFLCVHGPVAHSTFCPPYQQHAQNILPTHFVVMQEPAVSQEVLDRSIAKNSVLPTVPAVVLTPTAQRLNEQLNLLDEELVLEARRPTSEIYM